MNHQGLRWNVHCVAIVGLRKRLNLYKRGFKIYDLLVDSSFYLIGLARGTVFFFHGVQLARDFPPWCKWAYGEVFHPAVVPRPHFNLI